ncbi:MAG: LytTR family DNA-binding domain-containing protein [Lachnospiraceae bacterium]|nr:LytTR family DNA-binding domain-containing protein [Lachnospiraceae bacterium]
MLPIIICDDQETYRTYLQNLIEKDICMEELDMAVVLSAGEPNAVLHYISENRAPFLYFLDVDLRDGSCSGIDLASQIRRHDPRGFIVFITVHNELSPMTFQYRVEAMDYILKDDPENIPDRVKQCLLHARDLFSSKNNEVHKAVRLNIGEKVLFLSQEDIICLQASPKAHKIKIYTNDGIYEQAVSLREMAQQLNERFLACHKSCIINRNHIRQIDKGKHLVTMSNGMECPVSFRRLKALLE